MTGGISDPADFNHGGDVFNMSKTIFDDQNTGVALHSWAKNSKGTLGSNFTETWINCNTVTGLNKETLSEASHMSGSLTDPKDFNHGSDIFSMTKTDFDDQTYGVAQHSWGKNAKGVLGSNSTETWINCNITTGLNTSTLAVTSHMTGSLTDQKDFGHTSDVFSMTKTDFDDQTYGVAQHSVGKNAKGVLGSNFSETWIDCNTTTGLNISTLAVSSHMTGSLTDHNDFGHTADVFSMTKTDFDDKTYGVALHSVGKNAKGVLGSNFNETWINANITTGLNTTTLAVSSHMTGSLSAHDDFNHTSDVFSMTKTDYDDQTYGVALHSVGKNAKGVLGSNFNETWINANITTGLNTSTLSVSSHMTGSLTSHDDFAHSSDVFSMTKTDLDDKTYGVSLHSVGKNAKGVLGSNFNETWINANITTGLNTSTLSVSSHMTGSLTSHDDFSHTSDVFSMTKTDFDDQTYGVAQHSVGKNAKGVLGSNFNETWIDCNITTGLNKSTLSISSHMTGSLSAHDDFGHSADVFSMTKTDFDDQTYGVAQHSVGKNAKGVLGSNFNETWINCNITTGLNTSTLSVSSHMTGSLSAHDDFAHSSDVFSMTKTDFDDQTYGVALHSVGKNAKGVLGSNFSETWINCNVTTGLNTSTLSVSSHMTGSLTSPDDFNHTSDVFSMTKTLFDDQDTGVAQHSYGKNAKGILGSNFNETWINCNTTTGLNTSTLSVSSHMTGSLTAHDDFGHTSDVFSMTKTEFDDQTYGVALHSMGKNAKGVLGSNFSETWIDCNTTTGLNTSTLSISSHMTGSLSAHDDFAHTSDVFSMTKTDFDDQTYGVALHSMGKNSKGVLGSNFSETWINCNITTGLNTSTLSVSSHMTGSLTAHDDFSHSSDVFSMTKTTFDDQTTGVAQHSYGKNAMGLLGSNFTETWINCNTTTGLNTSTLSESSSMSGSLTNHDDFTHSASIFSMTKTLYEDQTTGVAQHSFGKNAKGLTGSNFSETWIDCNTTTGLNTSTISVTSHMTGSLTDKTDFGHDTEMFGMTKTVYDDQSTGVAQHSWGKNSKGLLGSNFNETWVDCNTTTGLNTSTLSISSAMTGSLTDFGDFNHDSAVFGMTKTNFDDASTGVALHSYGKNAKGLLGSNFNETWIDSNTTTGLNKSTISESSHFTGSLSDPNDFNHSSDIFSMTKTLYDDQTTGVAQHSFGKSAKGLLGSNFTETWINSNTLTGLNTSTISVATHMTGSLTDFSDFTHDTTPFSMTKTLFDDQHTGVAQHSYGKNAKGVLGSNFSETWIECNTTTGLNKSTISTTSHMTGSISNFSDFTHDSAIFGMTKTLFDDQNTGVAQHSYGKNSKGILGSNFCETWINVNTTTGLNTSTISVSSHMTSGLTDFDGFDHDTVPFNKTKTDFDDQTTGVARHSVGKAAKGVLGSNFSETWIDTNTTTGLNRTTWSLSGGMAGSETVADGNFTSDGNISGNTKTEFDDQNTGVGQHSLSKSGRGVYGSRFSETWIDCNTTTGLNKSTVVAAQGMTAGETVGDSTFTGDSKVMSRTKTVYDDTTTGVATHSYGTTYQGLNYARFTDTTITCNTTTGLNTSTTAIARGKGTASDPFEGNGPVFSTTTTDFDDQVTGVATNSTTTNTYGLGACLSSSVAKAEMVVNKYTGQNICTISRSEYGWTETWFKDTTTGVAKASDTNNCKGLIFARHSWVHEEDMAVDETTGLNQWTHSETLMSSSDTWYDSTYGTVNHTKTHNVYGLTKSADSETTSDNIIVNHDTGLTTWSKSVSDFGYTESWFKNDTYGNIDKTHTHNNYGAAKLLDTTTTFESNTYTNQHWGMNTFSTADGYLTTTSTWYESDYGTSTKSYAKNKNDKNGNSLSGANGARETWSDIVCNTSTGMNTSTVATNALGVTTTDVFDALYGTALHSTSDNTSGTTGSKHSETWIDASEETGLNRQTYSETKLSKTWTNFNTTTGGTTDSFSQMNDCANTLGWSKETTNYFFPNTDTNLNQYSVATNLAGWTETWYDSRGLGVANVNYSAVGVGFRTKTLTTCDNYWGITSSSTAYSYSRHGGKDSTELLSTTTSYMNVGTSGNGSNDGTVYHTDSTNQTGATNSSINHTNTTDYNAENGNKKKTFSWNLMGWSNTDYNDYGVESHTKNISYSGPTKGRVSDSYNTLWDGDTGIKRHGYSETGMSKTWSYFDENGMPSNDGVHTISYDSIAASVVGVSSIDVNAYTIKENLYGPAEGDKVEATAVTGDIWWSGVPSETTSYTALTSNRVEQDVNGFAKFSHTEKIFAANGSQATDTWNDVDQASGMTTHSHTINGATKHGTAYSDSYYDSTLGVVTKTENFNPKSDDSGGFDQTEAISQVDHSTGMTTDCETNNVGGDQYHNHSWGYDGTTGLNTYAHTDQKTQVGKGDGTKSYDSTFTYNPWTGLRKTEVRSNWANKTTDGDNPDYDMHYYDAHGVDEEAKSDCYSYPTGQQQQFTDFTGLGQDAEGNPIGMITKYGTDHTDTVDAMTVVNNHGSNAYCPTHSHITYDTATHKYITAVDINYTLVNNAPTSAIETDDHGTENWIMNGTYDQSGLVSRSRTVTGGGTYNWTYHPEDDPAGASFHEYATTSYTTYMGMYDGTGSESYTSSGLMTQQVLTNTNAMNETINFSNDGSFVTKGVGTRQDGQTTIYHFTGADLSSSEDDKGTTTWNTSTMQRQSTTGKMGTFTYTYFGNAITQITDTNNTMVFDQYWNLHQWTDSKNVVHTYTGTKFNKTKGNYWTQATETFTDSNGGAWTGTVTYDNWGYYFAGETLKGTHVKVDGSAAQNSTAMNTSTAATFIQGLLKKYNTSKEQAWSWTAPDDTPGRSPSTLGALQSALLNAGDLSLYADVEITINADGSTTSKYKNIYFNEENFVKENRYRPVVTHTANHVYVQNTRPSESDTRNWLSGNNKFASDGFGNHTYVSGGPTQVKVGSHQVQTGTDAKTGKPIYTSVDDYSYQWTVTSEDWGKTADGWMWVDQNTTTENHYADQLTETTNTVVAGPISTKTASSNAVGDTTLTDTTSTATAPVSTTLGSTGPSGTSGTLPGDTTAADQGTIFARPSASANTSGETGPRAKGAAVSAASTAPAPGAPVAKGQVPAAVGQDALLAKFASIKSLQDILAFVQMVADALGMQGILSGLEHSGAADLMKALVNAYKAVFGPAYHGSIVGKLVGMATDNNVVVDELQVAVNGNAALPNEVKLAARIAKELENAKRVTKDEDGKVVEAVDQKGGKYQYSYDASGLTETHTETNGQVTVTHYDNGGQLLSETTGGVSKTFSYQTNATGNVSGVTVTERSENGVATLGYDNKGRLVSADRNGQKSTITYDDSNNSYVVQDFNTGGDFQEARTYKEGHLAQVKRSDGSTINNEYMTDGSGKVLAMTETITDKDGKKSIMKYNGEGRLVTSLGEDAKKVEKTEEEGKIAEQAFGFEAGKETFGDPRMDGMRLDQKVMLQGVAPQQGAH
jgi:YD repeat-containing protein